MNAEEIGKSIDKIMPCTCIDAYTKRGLVAPDCANHNYKEDLIELLSGKISKKCDHQFYNDHNSAENICAKCGCLEQEKINSANTASDIKKRLCLSDLRKPKIKEEILKFLNTIKQREYNSIYDERELSKLIECIEMLFLKQSC